MEPPEDARRRRRQLSTLAELKAVSHPTRLRLFYALKASGEPMTATQLGEIVDESPASVSYHLRNLAANGFIEETSIDDGDRRQRWWQPSPVSFSWSQTDFGNSPGATAVTVAAKSAMRGHHWSRLSEYDQTASSWGDEWVRAAFSTDTMMRLTPDQTAALHADLQLVIDRYRTGGPSAESDDVATVMVLMHGFPTQI
ncbi:ArsR/SmtB family transcription factor [Williamsia sterculiae]|nr:helix-turn-helix domain-containing protein [Williamsia sterculiae]